MSSITKMKNDKESSDTTITIIVYEYPKAHKDVVDWAKKLKITEVTNFPNAVDWYFSRKHKKGTESISCLGLTNDSEMRILNLLSKTKTDKLVLWGAFKKDFLQRLVSSMDLADKL